MIIRHDLRLVFLHVPKCAGKELRQLLLSDAPPGQAVDRFNFSYSEQLHRHVDLAHQPLADLVHTDDYALLDQYLVIACIRDPYERLISAISEFHRQHSKTAEIRANTGQLSKADGLHYLHQLLNRQASHDPRFVHALPMHHFTHYGSEPKVDVLLRCEQLNQDFEHFCNHYGMPSPLRDQARQCLRPMVRQQRPGHPLEADIVALANLLYANDFPCFDYPMQSACAEDPLLRSQLETLHNESDAAKLDHIHLHERVSWHWGPSSERCKQTLKATRSDDPAP